MIVSYCWDKHKIDEWKTVSDEDINDLYQRARDLDDKLFIQEYKYKVGTFKQITKCKYSVKYRWLPNEFIDKGTHNESNVIAYLRGFILGGNMQIYNKNPEYIEMYNRLDNA